MPPGSDGSGAVSTGATPRPAKRSVVYCILPADLAGRLHDPLREHFAGDPTVQVVVERRAQDRRRGERDRRHTDAEIAAWRGEERRMVQSPTGRRVAERRTVPAPSPPLSLPRRARRYAERIAFVRRGEPSSEHAEDLDTARLVARFQGGDRDAAFSTIYSRYFDRVYSYLRALIRNRHDAEDLAQQVFTQVLAALPDYETTGKPFRAWLFTIARNQALMQLRVAGREQLLDPEELERLREGEVSDGADLSALGWITDPDLLIFVERLPVPQRQVLLLRYMLDLPFDEVARILKRTSEDVRVLQHRALRFLEDRLTAIGRAPTARRGGNAPMREVVKQATVLRSRRFVLRS